MIGIVCLYIMCAYIHVLMYARMSRSDDGMCCHFSSACVVRMRGRRGRMCASKSVSVAGVARRDVKSMFVCLSVCVYAVGWLVGV